MSDPTTKPRPDRTWLIIGLVFVAFWVFYLTFFLPGRGPELAEAVVDRPADFKWSLRDLDGKPVDLASFRGRTVFLNIWATWCPPCVSEMPSIAELASRDRIKEQNIAFLCISVDRDIDKVRDFVRDKKWPMTILHATDMPPSYETEAIPATFVISPAGRIVAAEVGASDWDRPEIIQFLLKTAATPAAPAPPPAAETPAPGAGAR
ncbi:TlpA family protein disulfide reductase [Aquisphaera insulae]|uniref:TlpA family protein disulfide reductase n=1 Tax=Aquisphaera insulae TaxID=2712864 RepID=UPI0013EC6D40|nr:TlpA disulfide reductase family protein [Aquisphaera insulae]